MNSVATHEGAKDNASLTPAQVSQLRAKQKKKRQHDTVLLAELDDTERYVWQGLPPAVRKRLWRYESLLEQIFVFRCFWTPVLMISEILVQHPLFSHKTQSRFLGHSRMLREMRSFDVDPSLGWFDEPEAGCSFWMTRYCSWMRAAEESTRFYIAKRCPDSAHPDARIAKAALFGAIENLSGLPGRVLGRMRDEFKREGDKQVEMFRKSMHQLNSARWDYPKVDLWLIEIWPVVVKYGWTYYDLWLVANKKFDWPEAPAFETAEALGSHCKMKQLGLRISSEAQKRSGRPRSSNGEKESPLPPKAELALETEPLIARLDGTASERLWACGLDLWTKSA